MASFHALCAQVIAQAGTTCSIEQKKYSSVDASGTVTTTPASMVATDVPCRAEPHTEGWPQDDTSVAESRQRRVLFYLSPLSFALTPQQHRIVYNGTSYAITRVVVPSGGIPGGRNQTYVKVYTTCLDQ